MGKKKAPIYKVVAADSKSPRDGRYIEAVGFYNPNTNPMEISFKEDKVIKWLKNGAKPTETVRSLMKRNGILLKINMINKGYSDEKINEEMQKFTEQYKEKLEKEKARKERRKSTKKKKLKESKETKETKEEKESKEESK